MATWEVKITPIDVERKMVSVVATRTDGLDVRTFSILNGVIDTAEQKLAIMEHIWGLYQASLAEDSKVATFLGDLEIQAKANLEGRE